ncbi:MAG: response regulator [Gammaproteobacteria bacterium]|nr:response regulator [Gammaproteobacteria bacterium]
MDIIKPVLFYFPTTTLFVDDDPAFLSNIGFEIDSKIPLISCDKSRHVVDLLEGKSSVGSLINKLVSHWDAENTDLPASWVMKTNIERLYEEIYNSHRFSYISTLVVDYSMPGLNGAELCKLLKDNPIKKIMLTGAADYNVAVELFNSGLIDYFIIKDNPQMADQLNSSIRKAQYAYFEEVTAPLIHSMPKSFPSVEEPAFWQYVANYFLENNFSEYYLIDDSGSFLFVDFYGNYTWMIIKSDKEIESYYNIAVDNEAPDDVIQALAKRQKIPFFFTEKDQKVSVSKWGSYLHPAKELENKPGLYCAIFSNDLHVHLEQEKILSHKDFMDKKCGIISN